jgi:hypothetical protein
MSEARSKMYIYSLLELHELMDSLIYDVLI